MRIMKKTTLRIDFTSYGNLRIDRKTDRVIEREDAIGNVVSKFSTRASDIQKKFPKMRFWFY